jgi:RNA polymerase sigma-70 factor (ECF subfamily)
MSSYSEDPAPDLLITGELVNRAKQGDPSALEALMARYHPRLVRWASGRLPLFARSLLDTSDLVQETLLKVIERIGKVEIRGIDSFQAYVRRAIVNRINDQVRWARRRPNAEEVPEYLADGAPLPIENAIGVEIMDRYERALEQLSEEERHFIHLRIELDFSYAEIAILMDRSTSDAARMAVQRSFRRLADIMGDGLL